MSRRKSKKRVKKSRDPVRKSPLRALKRRVKEMLPRDEVIIATSFGGIKMSKVMEKFVEPYYEVVKNEEEYRRLLTVAIIAWNATLMAENERAPTLRRLLVTLSEELRADAMEFIKELMVRKEKYFPEYRRGFIDYELTVSPGGWQLSVVSTATPL